MTTADLESIQRWIREVNSLRRVVISGRRKSHNPRFERIDIRPILIKEILMLQVVSHDGKRDLTKNFTPEELDVISMIQEGYANILIERSNETLTIRITKQGAIQLHRATNQDSQPIELDHDRKKRRLLPASDAVFQALGISDAKGNLIPRQSDKYRQVDDFLRIIEGVVDQLGESIDIADLGCGNAYLTFAVHRYLTLLGKKVKVVGVDNREDSRKRNSGIADSLGLKAEIDFIASNIGELAPRDISLAIALHACDTATDDALAWAVKSDAKVILVAPCCHHFINEKIKPANQDWQVVFRDGIMKERFADLMTDSLRAELLRISGYRTDIIEFVSVDHTPRNLLIRAVKTGHLADRSSYESLCREWAIKPYLETLLD